MGINRVLLLGNYKEQAMYHPLDDVENQLKEILKETAELYCTDDTSMLLRLTEEKFDGVVSYLDIWDSVLSEDEAQALEAFVADGGALLVLHNGISIQGRENLKNLVGAKFLTHPLREEIVFQPAGESHPITEGIEQFSLFEEPYQFEFAEVPYKLLLTYIYRGQNYPAGWYREIHNGRVVFLTPGHTAEEFKAPRYRKLITNSMLWCLHRL